MIEYGRLVFAFSDFSPRVDLVFIQNKDRLSQQSSMTRRDLD